MDEPIELRILGSLLAENGVPVDVRLHREVLKMKDGHGQAIVIRSRNGYDEPEACSFQLGGIEQRC